MNGILFTITDLLKIHEFQMELIFVGRYFKTVYYTEYYTGLYILPAI